MIYNKEKLLALGGVHQDKIHKWKTKPMKQTLRASSLE